MMRFKDLPEAILFQIQLRYVAKGKLQTRNTTTMRYIRKDKTKSDKIINDHIILIHYEVYNDGGCQCFKDCDCAKNKGIKSKLSNYKHSSSRRTFSTIEECEDDYTLTLDNQKKESYTCDRS